MKKRNKLVAIPSGSPSRLHTSSVPDENLDDGASSSSIHFDERVIFSFRINALESFILDGPVFSFVLDSLMSRIHGIDTPHVSNRTFIGVVDGEIEACEETQSTLEVLRLRNAHPGRAIDYFVDT
jgi:hypothetical protein